MANRIGRPRINKVGQVFGRLTVIAHARKDNLPAWSCLCSCGTAHVVKDRDLKSTKSCGCLRVDKGKATKTHGNTKTPEWAAWQKMKQRCMNTKNKSYKNYGGRGITVCAEWSESFECFLRDMGRRPSGASLDRINNNKGYSPENCRWATSKQQARNRRSNVSVVFNGKNMSMAELSDLCGKSIQVLHWRINKMNMTPQEAATKPMLRMRQGKKPGSNDAGKAAHYAEKLSEITASNDW